MANDMVMRLNQLVQTCLDGRNGYQRCAELVEDTNLRTQFRQAARQREQHAGELRQIVSRHGGTPSESGHVTTALHRAWIGLKKMVSGNDQMVVDECIRADEAAIRVYEEAMDGLSGEARKIARRQCDDIRRTVQDLRHPMVTG